VKLLELKAIREIITSTRGPEGLSDLPKVMQIVSGYSRFYPGFLELKLKEGLFFCSVHADNLS